MTFLNRLLYHGLILPMSRLPFSALYRISNVLYVLLYRVVGYRKKVVRTNIARSFPEKSEAERIAIEQEFYRHFCDLVVESLKVFTITKEEALSRMRCVNPEVMNKYFHEGRSVILAGAHYNNWELFAVVIHDSIQHFASGIYKPLTNTYFDEKMRVSRGRFGLGLIHNRKVKEAFEEGKNTLMAVIFAADQSPSHHSKPYWYKFLHQETAWLTGTEKYARDYNYPVVFVRIRKLRRGFYEFEFENCVTEPTTTRPGEITEKVADLIETDIRKVPAYWLWSHRRWKHQRQDQPAT